MRLFPALLLASLAFGQPKLTVTPPAQVVAGTVVTVPVVLSGSVSNMAAIQDAFTITATPAVTNLSVTSPLTNKSSVCTPGFAVCIIAGEVPAPTVDSLGNVTAVPGTVYNAAAISDGSTVQNIVFTVPATAALNSTITVAVTGTLAADAAGNLVTVAGSSATITVTTFISLANQAFTTWRANPTQANFVALVKAIAAAQ